ncbi:MAG: endonuclease/exonuclease/phosphatase family protein [Henriciella sp.]|nr:endonuclease/exonuclease/phosphatase family protein [Henriciella sp.]
MKAFIKFIAAAALAFVSTLCAFALFGQIVGPPYSWPFELMASFAPQLAIATLITAALAARFQPKLAIAAAAVGIVAGLPIVSFSKYESPSRSACGPSDCLTVITANLWGRQDAMEALSEIAEREGAQILGLNEVPAEMVNDDFLSTFPDHTHIVHAAWENMPKPMGAPIALISSEPLEDSERVLRDDTARRAYITADLGGDWQGLRMVVAHPVTPGSPTDLRKRNILLAAAGDAAEQSESFVFMGDFNLTPWAPKFRSLPGQRAADPRGSFTWPVETPGLGIPIDHVLFDGDLELVETRVLPNIGSDHHPILARFKRKRQE